MIDRFLLDYPVPLDPEHYPKYPAIIEKDGAILLPLSHSKFVTIPSFVESIGVTTPREALGLGRISDMPWEDLDQVWVSHPMCFPQLPTYAIQAPGVGVSPAIPDSFRTKPFTVEPGKMLEQHTLWSLWGFDAFIDKPGHQVQILNDKTAVVYTPRAVYRVVVPLYPKQLPSFTPGIFMKIPTLQLQRASEESPPLALAV